MKFLRNLVHFALALARELSDESAYARHLQAMGRAPSRSEWRRFSEGRHRRKYQNAKCC